MSVPLIVIPAKAGIQSFSCRRLRPWIPAFAGMTVTFWYQTVHFQ